MSDNEFRPIVDIDELHAIPVGKFVEADGILYKKVRTRKGFQWRVVHQYTSSQLFRHNEEIRIKVGVADDE
jgi:hypothetical protein